MGFLELDRDDQFIPIYFQDGAEVHLTVKSSKVEANKSGQGQHISIVLVPDDDKHDDIYQYQQLPNKADDAKKYGKATNRLIEMCDCLGIDISGFDPDIDMVGKSGYFILKYEDSAEFGKSNKIRRAVVSKASKTK